MEGCIMELNQMATSGADQSTSGDLDNNTTQTATSGAASENEQVSRKAYEKALKEKSNASRHNLELRNELDALKAKLAEGEENRLQEQNQYKELYEQTRTKLEESQGKHSALLDQIETGKKMSAVKSELMKRGMNPEHEATVFKLMDTSEVMLDPQTGVVIGAEDAAKSFHEQFKDLGLFGHKPVGVSHNAPTNNVNSDEDLNSLSQSEIMARLKSLPKV